MNPVSSSTVDRLIQAFIGIYRTDMIFLVIAALFSMMRSLIPKWWFLMFSSLLGSVRMIRIWPKHVADVALLYLFSVGESLMKWYGPFFLPDCFL